jgi:hypothetical protein
VPVRLYFFFGGSLFLVDATVRLVIVDTQQAIAVGEITSPAFGGGFQFFCHGTPFAGIPRTGLWRTDNSEPPDPEFSTDSIPRICPNSSNIPKGF